MRRSWILVFAMLSGCSAFEANSPVADPGLFAKGPSERVPSTDRLASDCAINVAFDACVFQKNPVAQQGQALTREALVFNRTYGIKLRNLSPTGYLENAWLRVLTVNTPRVFVFRKNQLRESFSETTSNLEQLNAYYWANRALEYAEARLGSAAITLRGLEIYVDDAFTGYSAMHNRVHLEKSQGAFPKAASGEVVVHFVGQALANALSGQRVFDRAQASAQHKVCELSPQACCATADGCSQALVIAFGDYFSAMLWPDQARVGETLALSPQGQDLCGLKRDLVTLSAQTSNQVFAACPVTGRSALMGAWYASLWWKIRENAESLRGGGARDIDQLFFQHARAWSATWTLKQAKEEALRVSGSFENGVYDSAFQAVFNSSGL